MMYTLRFRAGEVSRLQLRNVDLDRCVLSIRQTKFAKDRLVLSGPKLGPKLAEYIVEMADRAGRRHSQAPLFSFRCARPIDPCTISHTFGYLVRGHPAFLPPPGVSAPKLHCLRHSVAVGTLLRWYRAGRGPLLRRCEQIAVLAVLLLAGRQAGLGGFYATATAAGALLFLYQQYLIRDREPAACFRAFLNNNWVGAVVFAGIVADYHWT